MLKRRTLVSIALILTMVLSVGLFSNSLVSANISEEEAIEAGQADSAAGGSSPTSSNCNILPASICDPSAQQSQNIEDSAVWQIVLFIIQTLTVLVGLAALAGIVYGAILYTSSGGSPERAKKARTVITNVVIGVVAYALMYALLQWIIPGGVFG